MKREKTFRERLWEEATGHCIYCGKPVSLEEMEADHIVPLCQGGDNSYENKVCSCPCCNARKAGLDLEEFLCKNMKHCELKARSFRLHSSAISLDHPLINRCVAMGLKPFGSPTLSDQALMSFPSFKLGPGESSRSHSADEYICRSEIAAAIEKYLEILEVRGKR